MEKVNTYWIVLKIRRKKNALHMVLFAVGRKYYLIVHNIHYRDRVLLLFVRARN